MANLKQLNTNALKYGGIVLGAFITLIILVRVSIPNSARWCATNNSTQMIQKIQTLLHKIRTWHLTSVQDSHPVLKLLHSTTALSYFQVLNNILLANISVPEMEQLTGTRFSELQTYLENDQQAALHEVCKHCPQLPDVKHANMGSH